MASTLPFPSGLKLVCDALDPSPEAVRLRETVARLEEELSEARAQIAALEALAHEDALTETHNRRGFVRDLIRATAYRTRYGTPAALLVADLDGFKAVNDRFGHPVGDACLAHVARLLKRNIRASDTLGRLGGDEFAMIIWHVDAVAAEHKARMLERLVDQTPLDHEGLRLPLGLSIGVSELADGDTPEAALARADRAMYLRKSERRRAQAMMSGVI